MADGRTLPDRPEANASGDTALLVLSCDACADVWPVFFTLFFRYWPDCPLPVHLGANHLRYPDKRVSGPLRRRTSQWRGTPC